MWILDRLSRHPPDVFVPNLMVPAFYAARWVREAGIPTVGILHSDDEFHRGVQSEFIFGSAEYRLSAIVCVSRYIEAQVRAQKPHDVTVARLPYGVRVPKETATYPRERPLRIVVAGRLSEKQKRISEVVRSLCRVVKGLNNVEAVIYGDGRSRDAVKQILEREGAGLPIRLMGAVDNVELQRQLLHAHIFALLSDYEGLSIALMEAMAAGLVPICLRMRSGVPELIEHGVTGLLVNDRENSFFSAARALREDSLLWAKLSAGARERIDTEYAKDVCSDKWTVFLKELAIDKANRGRLECPRNIALPPVSQHLAREDRRREPAYAQLLNKFTDKSIWITREIKHRLMGV